MVLVCLQTASVCPTFWTGDLLSQAMTKVSVPVQ